MSGEVRALVKLQHELANFRATASDIQRAVTRFFQGFRIFRE
jgi:hypothetical protein